MSVSGYIRGKPDPNWWMEQIWAGIKFREKYAQEKKWKRWREYYRGQFRADVLPVNIFFSLLRTVVPRVYFRNPSVSISPDLPGLEAMAFAQILNRVDNKLIRQMKLKKQMKAIVHDTFLFGTGFGKIGFGAMYTPTPTLGGTSAPIGKSGESVEYGSNIMDDMPWFSRVKTGDVIVPIGTDDIDNARWIANWIRRPIADIKADSRLTNTDEIASSSTSDIFTTLKVQTPMEMGDLIEIRDRKTREVFVLAPYANSAKVLMHAPDELQEHGFPILPLVFNPDDEVFWGVPDSVIIEPHQLELNEIRTQAMKHRRLALVKWFARQGSIDDVEIAKMLSDNVSSVVKTKKNPKETMHQFQTAHIPQELYKEAEQIMQDVREAIGFSRNQMAEKLTGGGGGNRTTATEANIIKMAAEIRVDERRDAVADLLVEVVKAMHTVIFNHWTADQVVDVVGPGGLPVWVKFTGNLLSKGQYTVRVDPDAGLPETRQLRERKAIELYTVLKQNPLIDPTKLTQYLLHELHGVQFDDMMRMLPPAENSPTDAVGQGDFAKLIGSSISRVKEQPDLLRPPMAALGLPVAQGAA